MKQKLLTCLLALITVIYISACTSTPQSQTETEGQTQAEQSTSNNGVVELGDASIKIGDSKLAKTYDGKDAIIINMEYTNNSEDSQSYMTSIIGKAFQDGVELSSAIIMDADAYDAESQMKELKKGASIDVQIAYELSNTTSDVELEVEEFLGMSDKKATKTFKLSE